jgi:hypothetical protein
MARLLTRPVVVCRVCGGGLQIPIGLESEHSGVVCLITKKA